MLEPDFTYQPFEELRPTQDANTDILKYWNTLRGKNKLPSWSAFDPLDITKQLTNTMVIHCPSKDVSRITLFGTSLVKSLGIDLTGMNFLDIYTDEERSHSMARTWAIRSRPAAGQASFVGKTSGGGPFRAEVLTLPFLDDQNGIDHLLLSVSEYAYEKDQPNTVFTLSKDSFDDYRFYDL